MGYDRTTLVGRNMTGFIPPTATGGELVSIIAQNYFKHDGTTMQEFETPCTYGWKAVSAFAPWQGEYGFLDTGAACCGDEDGVMGKSNTKYTTKTETLHGKMHSEYVRYDCDGLVTATEVVDYELSGSQTSSVDAYGNITRTGAYSVKFKQIDNGVVTSDEEWCDYNPGALIPGHFLIGSHMIPANDFPLTAQCGIISYGGGTGFATLPATSGTPEELNAANLFTIGGRVITEDVCDEGVIDPQQSITASGTHATFSLGNTEIKASWDVSGSGEEYSCCEGVNTLVATQTANLEFEKTVTLSGENPYSNAIAEAESLLGEWDLTDDTVYPWRTDAATSYIPHVSRDAAPNIPSLMDGPVCDFENDVRYTGELMGAPLPAGYGYFFNYYHNRYCAELTMSGCQLCSDGVGELGASPLPATATQWPNKFDAPNWRGPGAHLWNWVGGIYGPAGMVDGVYAQKWAETLVEWPSENYARPCARDRYLFDETDVACGLVSGTDLTLDTAPATPFSAGDRIAAGGNVYAITGGSGLAYTVGSALYNTPIYCDGAARLRFPSARAIAGMLAATAVQTSPGLITVTTSGSHRLKAGGTEFDLVTFTGIGGLTTAIATPTGDDTFEVSGTLTTSPDTGYVSDGATGADITNNNTCSTHKFVYREYQSTRDGVTYAESDLAIAPTKRSPTVICISPNGEVFPHGVTYGFGTIGADQCNGEQWSAVVTQAAPSPFWQADHMPCGHSGGWSMSPNPCTAPTGYDYPFPPLVEASTYVPPGGVDQSPASIPGALGSPSCDLSVGERGFPMSWRPSWLTCTDWQELIQHNCG